MVKDMNFLGVFNLVATILHNLPGYKNATAESGEAAFI